MNQALCHTYMSLDGFGEKVSQIVSATSLRSTWLANHWRKCRSVHVAGAREAPLSSALRVVAVIWTVPPLLPRCGNVISAANRFPDTWYGQTVGVPPKESNAFSAETPQLVGFSLVP